MKKICCMLLVCMMIFTGISMPAFAAEESDIQNLNDYQINMLKVQVDYVFKNVIKGADFSQNEGLLLDAVCCSDMLFRYYKAKHNEEQANEYLAKRYIISIPMIDILLKGKRNDLDIFRQKVSYLFMARSFIYTRLKSELYLDIDVFGYNLLQQILPMGIYSDCKILKEVWKKLIAELPKSHKDVAEFVYNTEGFSERCQLFFNNSQLFNLYKEGDGLLKADIKNVYRIENIIKNIFLRNFNFVDGENHIAFSFLSDNELFDDFM